MVMTMAGPEVELWRSKPLCLSGEGEYTGDMNGLNLARQFVAQFGEAVRPKKERERRESRATAIAVAFVATLALLYHFLT